MWIAKGTASTTAGHKLFLVPGNNKPAAYSCDAALLSVDW